MLVTMVDSYVTKREEFQLTRGYQPSDSLFFVKNGSFCCSFEQNEHTVDIGEIAIFDRHTQMSRHVTEPLSFLYIKFTARNEALFPINSGVFSALSDRELFDLEKIEELSAERTRASLELREHYLNDLLISLYSVSKIQEKSDGAPKIPSVLDLPISYMKENLKNKLSVGEIALSCGMSESSLESKFRELLGASVYDYLISLRIDHSKRLLTETSLTISEISARCGYENQFYFSNAFKKQTNMTPSDYRRSNII